MGLLGSGIGGDNPHALDPDAFQRFALFPSVSGGRRCIPDFFQNIIASDQPPESSVIAIKEVCVRQTNEELTARGVRIGGSSHGNNPPHMRPVVKLRFDRVVGPAGSPTIFHGRIFGERIATLDHETLNDPVKSRAIEKTGTGQLLEILDGFRCDLRPKFDGEVAFRGGDDCDFLIRHSESDSIPPYFTESAETILMLSTPTRTSGRS